jgi:hypothetical protein
MKPTFLLAALVAAFACSATHAETRSPAMHDYALVFRTRSLPPEEVARRAPLVRDWAVALRERGTLRASTLLEDEGVAVAPDGSTTPVLADGAVAALTVIQAADLAAAVALAKTFPGLAFGTTVEVRPVRPLPGPPPPPK